MASDERIRLAISAFTRGDYATARREAEAALKQRPNDPNVLQLVGVICCQSGETKEGAEYFRRALRQGEKSLELKQNLGRALLELGETEEAARLFEQDGTAPDTPDGQRMYADILKAQGRHWEAMAHYERLVAAKPDDPEAWNNLGNARHEMADFDGALDALQRACRLDPESALIRTNLGRLLISMDRYQDACLVFEQAALRAPQDSAILLELGRTLTSINHPESALKALGTAARLNPRDPKIFVAIGTAFNDVANPRQAEQAFRFAIQIDPSHAPAYLNLGLLLEKSNRIGEMSQVVAQAGQNGIGAELDFLRALLLSREGRLGEALDLSRSVSSKAISPVTVAHFSGQLADRLNRTEEAYAAFEEMNRAAAESPLGVGVDRTAYQRGVDGLAAQTTKQWYESWPSAPAIKEPPSPAFLVGFPRSGTTLLDTILMGHEGAHVLEEIPILEKISNDIGGLARIGELGAGEVAEFRGRYFAELQRLSPAPPGKLVIDKNPLSMLRVPLIHRLFPDAKIILLLRHPCDVVLSCYMQNFKVTEAMASFLDLENASRTYDRIFAYWEQCRDIFPIDVHTLRYEAMVEDVEAEVRPLLDFLGLAWDEKILDHRKTAINRGYIRTPSYSQVTEPVYSRASGRWERYSPYMSQALPFLSPWAERFGYGPLYEPDEAA